MALSPVGARPDARRRTRTGRSGGRKPCHDLDTEHCSGPGTPAPLGAAGRTGQQPGRRLPGRRADRGRGRYPLRLHCQRRRAGRRRRLHSQSRRDRLHRPPQPQPQRRRRRPPRNTAGRPRRLPLRHHQRPGAGRRRDRLQAAHRRQCLHRPAHLRRQRLRRRQPRRRADRRRRRLLLRHHQRRPGRAGYGLQDRPRWVRVHHPALLHYGWHRE